MGPHMRRILVIDASILKAAGTKGHAISKCCRKFLEAVLKICHKAALSHKLALEWKRHCSKYATRWQKLMRARRKVVQYTSEHLDPIESSVSSGLAHTWNELDDTHLIVLALASDEIVVSLDETARKRFAAVAPHAKSIGKVCWVNPSDESENALEWVKAGARREARRRLSYGGSKQIVESDQRSKTKAKGKS